MWSLSQPPLFAALEKSERVLIAGAGGGFDVYAGLPLALALAGAGKEVHLANLTFTVLDELDLTDWVAPGLAAVTAQAKGGDVYFPAAVRGDFGDQHFTTRTGGSELFINPLMALYFSFDLLGVYRNLLYRNALEPTQTPLQVGVAIERFRETVHTRPYRDYPH